MVVNIDLGLLAILVGLPTALCVTLIWVGSRIAKSWDSPLADVDQGSGTQDQMTFNKPYSPFIPMPDHLKTHYEMVTWMTTELPKLTADMLNPRV